MTTQNQQAQQAQQAQQTQAIKQQIKRGRGRPKGSKNKNNVSNRCCAIIKHNIRCSKQKLPGEEFCGHHIKKNRCHAYSKYGIQCCKQKIDNSCFCKYHLNNHMKYGYKKCEEINDTESETNTTSDSDNDENESDNDENESDNDEIEENNNDNEIENQLTELWKVEEEHINVVVNNQIWKFYPKREQWIKCNDNYDQIKEFFEEVNN